MAMPDFQAIMLPLVKFAASKGEATLAEAADFIAQKFALTDAERAEMLPSGRQKRFNNRIGWAATHLRKAGVLDYPGRGRIRITSRGADLIRQAPATINLKLLMQYPEFVAFRQSGAAPDGRVEVTGSSGEEPQVHSTPEEKLEASYKESRNRLAEELQELMLKCSPAFFERLVIDVLVEMGYGGSREDAAEVLGKTGDNGVDGIIKEDKLGLDAIYVQAKRWQGTVGRPELQAFAGSLEGHRARKGVFITTSAFSREARDYVRNIEKKIVLLDGPELAKHMIDHGVGVSDVATYKIRRVDLDYFDESK